MRITENGKGFPVQSIHVVYLSTGKRAKLTKSNKNL